MVLQELLPCSLNIFEYTHIIFALDIHMHLQLLSKIIRYFKIHLLQLTNRTAVFGMGYNLVFCHT